jgi:plastocyanin
MTLAAIMVVAACGPNLYRVATAAPLAAQMPYGSPYNAPASSTGVSSVPVSQTGGSVHVVDFAFSPSSISIPAGSSVTWTNTGMQTHTTTADNGAWNSGPLRPGMTFTQLFSTAGTFSYHCMIHPSMVASVTVTPSTAVAAAQANPATGAPLGSSGAAVSVSLAAGWSIIAGPAGTVVSGANGPLYTFRAGDTAYETIPSSTPLTPGSGYWAYFNAPVTESLPSSVSQPVSVQLPANQWVMVGNPTSGSISVSGADSLLTYNSAQGYQPANTLMSGQGAWAFSSAGGALTVTSR